jgi:hypothetical protein
MFIGAVSTHAPFTNSGTLLSVPPLIVNSMFSRLTIVLFRSPSNGADKGSITISSLLEQRMKTVSRNSSSNIGNRHGRSKIVGKRSLGRPGLRI